MGSNASLEPVLESPRGSASTVCAAPAAQSSEPTVHSARSAATPFDPRKCLPWRSRSRKSPNDCNSGDATTVDIVQDWVPQDAWELDGDAAKAAVTPSSATSPKRLASRGAGSQARPSSSCSSKDSMDLRLVQARRAQSLTSLASTPSTASPAHLSQPESRDFSSSNTSFGSLGSRPASVLSQSDSDVALADARQRQKMSLEMLQMELKGFGDAVAVRYASWPPECIVKIATRTQGEGHGVDDSSSLLGKFVAYDATARNIEVRLKDGTSRIVPATLVTRVYGRGRVVRGDGGNSGAHPGDLRTAANHLDRGNVGAQSSQHDHQQRFNANLRQDIRQ